MTFWKRNGASHESFYWYFCKGGARSRKACCKVQFRRGLGQSVTQKRALRVSSVELALRIRMYTVACTHVCVEATSVGLEGSDAIVTTQPCIIGRGKHTEGREQTQAYCDVVPLCVWSLSEVGYIIAKCECSPTSPSAGPLCSLRNIPALPFTLFFSSTYLLSQSVFPLLA